MYVHYIHNHTIMKYLSIFILSFTCLITFGQVSDEDMVRKTFNEYKTAILNDDAQKALYAVDSRTTKYYTDILHDVKTADSVKISSMSLIDRLTILILRAKASKSEIAEMKDTDAFIYAIKNGMVGKNSVMNNSVGEVSIDGSFAKGRLIAEGQQTSFYFNFYKEEGVWKLDLTALFSISNHTFKKMAEESETDENTFLFEILESLSGKKITSEIWEPVL